MTFGSRSVTPASSIRSSFAVNKQTHNYTSIQQESNIRFLSTADSEANPNSGDSLFATNESLLLPSSQQTISFKARRGKDYLIGTTAFVSPAQIELSIH